MILDYLARPIGPADTLASSLAPASDVRAARFFDADGLTELPMTDGLAPLIQRARASFRAWRSGT